MPEIAEKPEIRTGKNAGKHPSVASLYRALADAAPAAGLPDDGLPPRPRRTLFRRPGEPFTSEEIEMPGRLISQERPDDIR